MNIAKLLASFNVEIGVVPDNLKCAECKSVLADACQLLCSCRFCRTCIDNVRASGVQFCPGSSLECSESLLSTAVPDYNAVKSVSRLTAKCLQSGCLYECPLVDIEGHLRVCQRKTVECPFHKFGCEKNELTAKEMSDHLLQDSRGHSEILIAMLTNINGNMETLKDEMVSKDEQIRTMMDEMKHVQNENKLMKGDIKSMKGDIKSIKDENKLIKREKKVLSERVRQLTEDDKRDIQSVKDDVNSMKLELQLMQSSQAAVAPKKVNARLDDWLIDVDINNTHWNWESAKTSDCFTGKVHSYTYQLAAGNNIQTTKFRVELRIVRGPSDSLLRWPFYGEVSIIVKHRDIQGVSTKMTKQCRIERPNYTQFNYSERFVFYHFNLHAAGIDLSRGVRVSCVILPGAVIYHPKTQ